jgi:hypothetical protein
MSTIIICSYINSKDNINYFNDHLWLCLYCGDYTHFDNDVKTQISYCNSCRCSIILDKKIGEIVEDCITESKQISMDIYASIEPLLDKINTPYGFNGIYEYSIYIYQK